jgi:hypothetical protein
MACYLLKRVEVCGLVPPISSHAAEVLNCLSHSSLQMQRSMAFYLLKRVEVYGLVPPISSQPLLLWPKRADV